jgi:dolichyl-diphosphooligosaccharide--protein glycosyltransferase
VLIRIQPADYGFQLNEFDPFFNYRATEFIVENGLPAYFSWHDDMTWHYDGRDVSATSQAMLHASAAILYQIFGGDSDLYNFVIIFPVVFGSLTTIVIFALVRVIGGTTAGLFATLFYSVAFPITIRGTIGWFKSEPFGLFLGLLSLYLFLSGLKSDKSKSAILKLFGSGIFLGFAFSAWGGSQFFILPLGVFVIILPFVRRDNNFLIRIIPAFVFGVALSLLAFEKPGVQFFATTSGLVLLTPVIFLLTCITIQRISTDEKRTRNNVIFLVLFVSAGIFILSTEVFASPSLRYLSVINPFLIPGDVVVKSVAEHAIPSTFDSFFSHSLLMPISGIGIWIVFENLNRNRFRNSEEYLFALIIGLLGVYVGSSFIRLELLSSISIIILASIGLSTITKGIFSYKKKDGNSDTKSFFVRVSYSTFIIIILIIPLIIPVDTNWIDAVKMPPSILNGGGPYKAAANDWLDALDWIKNNTPQDAVVAAWWDYGYWITTLGERKTLADNATVHSGRIIMLAVMLMNSESKALDVANYLEADYILVYFYGYKIVTKSNEYFTMLEGDISKINAIAEIAGADKTEFVQSDNFTPSDHFWQNTLLGKMIPLKRIGYFDSNNYITNMPQPGNSAVYIKESKFSDENDPLKLVYVSPSFDRNSTGFVSVVAIYENMKN